MAKRMKFAVKTFLCAVDDVCHSQRRIRGISPWSTDSPWIFWHPKYLSDVESFKTCLLLVNVTENVVLWAELQESDQVPGKIKFERSFWLDVGVGDMKSASSLILHKVCPDPPLLSMDELVLCWFKTSLSSQHWRFRLLLQLFIKLFIHSVIYLLVCQSCYKYETTPAWLRLGLGGWSLIFMARLNKLPNGIRPLQMCITTFAKTFLICRYD